MKIPSAILATVALLVASASARQEPLAAAQPVDASTEVTASEQGLVEPRVAEPVGFHQHRSEFEAIERGEWPQSLPAYEIPETTDEKFKASGLSGDEIQEILDHHNYYRSLHGANPLSWNWEAANFGENWLQYCAFQHSHGKFGENLAAGYNDFPSAIKVWYDEVNKYNFNAPGFTSGTGHFTQVVWKSTTSVGCATRACSRWTIYICNYNPPGNMVSWDNGYFRDNVSPPL